ncbi:MAG: aldehyde dehydrogenase family protein [bacterium]
MSNLKNKIENIFPDSFWDIPFEHRIEPLEQTYFLGANGITSHMKYGRYQKIFSPISVAGQPVYLGKVPMMNEMMVNEIIAAQSKAWDDGNGQWPMMTHQQRTACIRLFIEEMKKARKLVVLYIMWETCKSLKDSYAEFDRTVNYLTDTCNTFEKLVSNWEKKSKEGHLTFTLGHNAAGRVLSMGPSNYPLNETLQIVVPLLLTGNVVTIKPAKSGILLLEPIIKCFAKTLPNGVVTTLYGDGRKVISPVVSSGNLEFFAFIGGTWTADAISKKIKNPHQVGSFKGLAAKNPLFGLKGANMDLLVKLAVDSSIRNNKGERCTATKKNYIDAEIYDEFIARCIVEFDNFKIGMPWEEGIDIPPLLPGSVSWLQKLLKDALDKGAKIANECGGMVNGGYMHPVLLVDVTEDMRIANEEQFGPIMFAFKMEGKEGLKKALHWVKTSGYGQQISIVASKELDHETVDYVVHQTTNQVCQVNINCTGKRYDNYPFSGRGLSGQDSISLIEAILLATFPYVTVVDESYE